MKEILPQYFKSVLWSHDLSVVDPDQSSKLLISKAINYGDLRHWRWISKHYGAETVRRILLTLPPTAIRPGARALAEIVFSLPHSDVKTTPRSSHA